MLFPGIHSHSQITDYLKGKFHSTKKSVQLCEAADVINGLFPKDHQTLNFSCQRGADLHGYPCYYQTLRRKVNSVLSSQKAFFAFPSPLPLNPLCLQVQATTLEMENLILSAQVEQNEKGKKPTSIWTSICSVARRLI